MTESEVLADLVAGVARAGTILTHTVKNCIVAIRIGVAGVANYATNARGEVGIYLESGVTGTEVINTTAV